MSITKRTAAFSAAAAVLWLFLGGVGCDRAGAAGNAPATRPAGAAPAGGGGAGPAAGPAATAAKAGYAVGRIARADGKPVGIDGVKYEVFVSGVTAAGNNVTYSPKPAADGTWSTKLADGVYKAPRARVTVPFEGESFRYGLEPTADAGGADAADGVVADFVWKFSGPQPRHAGKPDPADHTHWRGASADVTWDPYYTDAAGKIRQHEVAEGTRFVFTATPNGKLIDGSDGKPVVWDRGWEKVLRRFDVPALNDLPPAKGGWRVTAKQMAAAGAETPLVLKAQGQKEWVPAVDVKVAPSQRDADFIYATGLWVTLPTPAPAK